MDAYSILHTLLNSGAILALSSCTLKCITFCITFNCGVCKYMCVCPERTRFVYGILFAKATDLLWTVSLTIL